MQLRRMQEERQIKCSGSSCGSFFCRRRSQSLFLVSLSLLLDSIDFHLSFHLGLAFGHLDSRTSIRRVLVVTCMLALAYSLCQGTLELIAPDERYYVVKNQLRLYSHGGTIFW